MKKRIVTALLLAVGMTAFSQNHYTLSQHSISIKGSSSLHDWMMNVNQVNGSGTIEVEAQKLKSISQLQIEIPVTAIISDRNSKKMDDNAHDALGKRSFPLIKFQLSKIYAIKQTEKGQLLNTKGVFNVAGVSREEDLTVYASMNKDGSIRFHGDKKIFMTDYKIKPPKAMMNLLTTGNEVNVQFDILMNKI